MYSSTLPSTSALDGVGGQPHAPVAFPPGKDPVLIVLEAGCTPGPVWTGTENLAPNEIRSVRTALYRPLSLSEFCGYVAPKKLVACVLFRSL